MTRGIFKTLLLTSVGLALTGCSSHWDLQGWDPKNYYAEHPIKNRLASHEATYTVHFLPGQTRLADDEIDGLRSALRDISPAAADAVTLHLSDADMHNDVRKQYLAKLLRNLGYGEKKIMFQSSAALARDDIEVDIAYVTVVSPDCPDWKTSPVTTYSNTKQGNFGCAAEVNLGLMVADPHDLVRGTGDVPPEAERDYRVIQDYRANKSMAPAAAVSSGSSGGVSPSGLTPPANSGGESSSGGQ